MAVARWTRDLLLAGWHSIPQTAKDGDGSPTWEKDPERERIVSYLWESLSHRQHIGNLLHVNHRSF
jgi:hypothetical protein